MTKNVHHKDNVNHPHHYNNSNAKCKCGKRIECIDVIRHMNFNIGNAVKYLWRFQDKNVLEDLKKAAWYLNDAIKTHENKSERESFYPDDCPSSVKETLFHKNT